MRRKKGYSSYPCYFPWQQTLPIRGNHPDKGDPAYLHPKPQGPYDIPTLAQVYAETNWANSGGDSMPKRE